MKKFKLLLICSIAFLFLTSCNTYRQSMRETNVRFEFNSDDIELSEPIFGQAVVTRIFFIDWARLFGYAKLGSKPVIGSFHLSKGANYALYDLLQKRPGYDMVMYPQVEIFRHAPVLGTDLYSRTTYRVTARLAKLKNK